MVKRAAFYCATFRRPELLEQAIACFLAQDWDGEKRLVIVNDEPEQELVFDHPDVQIFNRRERIPLAAKLNVAVSECIEWADVLFHMDDDDLFSPQRASVSISGMAGGVFKTPEFLIDIGMQRVHGRNLGNYAFTPRVFVRYGGYRTFHDRPFADINLMTEIDYYMAYHGYACTIPETPFFLYRKGLGICNYSMTGRRDHNAVAPSNVPFKRGRIDLCPKSYFDWGMVEKINNDPVKIHTVDASYSDVDLTVFHKGIRKAG